MLTPPGPAKSWRDQALCLNRFYTTDSKGMTVELWFPERGQVKEVVEQAKAICAECPAREACLDDALARGERDGIRGGTTPNERRSIKRRQQKSRLREPKKGKK